MSDVWHFSITTITLLIIVLISVFAGIAATTPLARRRGVVVTTAELSLTMSTPNLPVTTSTRTPKTVTSFGIEQNPDMTFDLRPQNLSVAVGDTFEVTVAVENVTDMYAWQAYLCFNHTVVECTGVSLPSEFGFSNKVTVSDVMKDYNATEFPHGPLQRVRNDLGWVLAGDCLFGSNQTAFNGSCVLCQIGFKAVSSGSTALELLHDSAHTFQTYVVTPSLTDITSESASYSYVYVTSD
jgi:hypothetical protein